MNNETQPLDYERPDWTAEEMEQTPPFRCGYAEMINIDARTRRAERRTGWLIPACLAVILIGAAGVVLL